MAYTKLFNSIVTSTIWTEDDRTRIVWITMLAIADKNGEVQASVPGLARLAGVPVEDCRKAITRFLSPDLDSRTKDDEGRRIEIIEGGWSLLNFRKYREMASREDMQASEAERKARYRAKLARNVPKCPGSVPVVSTPTLHIAEAEAEAEAKADLKVHSPHSRVALFFLNEKSGKAFRETTTNLSLIDARLAEPGVDIAGVKQMIERQCKRWLGTTQAEYLRPETLFGKSKFDGYYASKEMEVINENIKPSPSQIRNSTITGAEHASDDAVAIVARRAKERAAKAAEFALAAEVAGHGVPSY